MTDTMINPESLKTIRKARKLSRPRLARLTGLTERQVARLEGGVPARDNLSSAMVLRVAQALQVDPLDLSGEAPTDHEIQPMSKSSCSCCG